MNCHTVILSFVGIDISITINLIRGPFSNQPPTDFTSRTFLDIPRFFQNHSEPVKRHRFFDTPFDDEFVGDFGGGHELAIAVSWDVKIDGEQLFLVLLRTEIFVVPL